MVHAIGTSNFLVPNGAFFVELVAFLVVLFILARYVLPRLNSAIEERQKTIRKGMDDAERADRRAKEAEADYKKTLDQARQEARSLVDEARQAGERMRAELRERGEAEYERIVSRAQADIDASARRAAAEVRQDLAQTVIEVVRKVVGEGLDVNAHRQLIDRTIADVEREAESGRAQSEVGS